MQRGRAGVAGQLSGDVQDAVAQSFRFADFVFAVERELLGPDRQVVCGERELEPRGVRGERVEREVRAAGRFERLDAVFDFGVLTVGPFERGEVIAGLVGDEALEAVAIEVGERELRAWVWTLAAADQTCPRASPRD